MFDIATSRKPDKKPGHVPKRADAHRPALPSAMKPDGWALRSGGQTDGVPDGSYASLQWAQWLYKCLTHIGYWGGR
ncbi:MAG: hypothetical protein B7Z26_02085, partial [Asticcacaulis sp. 32-58-5]